LSLHGRDNDQFNSRPAYLAIALTILEALILLIFLPETLKNNEKRKNVSKLILIKLKNKQNLKINFKKIRK